MTPALPVPSRKSTKSSPNTRMNVGFNFKCAEMPIGHQYRRKKSPIGVPRPVRVRISFSSLVVLYIEILRAERRKLPFATKITKNRISHLQKHRLSFIPFWSINYRDRHCG